MMSPNGNGPHHKIWSSSASARVVSFPRRGSPHRADERGYTLVALLAVMTVMAIVALAAAPSIRQQAQREREQEAIFRGEQIAEAIRVYYSNQESRLGRRGIAGLPTSMDQLLEGVPGVGTKKLQVLRASAARDPLSDTGEWKLVAPASREIMDFTREVMLYSENIRPTTRDPQLQAQEQFMAPIVLPSNGGGSPGSSSATAADYSGPFIGTASHSGNNSVIYYYGIARHDGWVFTPFFR